MLITFNTQEEEESRAFRKNRAFLVRGEMGESACLIRSFSHPSESCRESREDDPIRRALTESVSFGRYVSESLAWEKWSTFSHNRYLEEVEKFSKAGSVAQKKAFFEAHYKKKAAMREAALLEKENETSNNSIQGSKVEIETCSQSPLGLEGAGEINHLDVQDQEESICDRNNYSSIIDNLRPTNSVENVDVGVCAELENSKEPKYTENQGKDVSSPHQLLAARDKLFLPPSCAAKGSFLKPRAENVRSVSKRSTEDSINMKVIAKPVNKISTRNSTNKKILPSPALHMSINFPSQTSESSYFSTRKTCRDDSNLLRHPAMISSSGALKHASVIDKSEHRRTNAPKNESVLGGVTALRKSCSISRDSPKISSACGINARASNVVSPFSFKSEERAEKRKQFFQKLEERNKAKEAEKLKLPTKYKTSVTQPRSPNLVRKPVCAAPHSKSSHTTLRSAVHAEISSCFIAKTKQTTTADSVRSVRRSNSHENASPNIPN